MGNALTLVAVLGLGYLLLKNGSITLPPSISNALNSLLPGASGGGNIGAADQAIATSGQFARSGLTVGASSSAAFQEAGAAIAGSAVATGPAAPFVAAAGVLVGLFGQIFHGANPLQVPAAQLEQIYEALVDNIAALYKQAHMISKDAAIAGMNTALQAAIAVEQQSGLGVAAQRAMVNIKSVISNSINAVANLPNMPAISPIDVQTAQSYYVGGPGWYPQSIRKASELTAEFLTQLSS